MEYKFIIQGRVVCTEDEVIGAKETISETLELIGYEVDNINVIQEEEE